VQQLPKIIVTALLFIAIYLVSSFIYYQNEVDVLTHKKYLQTSKAMQNNLQNLIKSKSDSALLIAISLSANSSIKDALKTKDYQNIGFQELTQTLQDNFSFSHLWFHLIMADGTSFYRSWTDKKGDNILNTRKDVKKILLKPKIFSTISVGKYDMTFKAIVPIFDNKKLIGLAEVITKFYSVGKKMQLDDNHMLVVVDKSYKKQLTHPYSKTFIGDYYVAYGSQNKKLLHLIEKNGLQKYLNIPKYSIDAKNNLLVTTFHLPDINGKPMGYFIITKDLKKIDLSEVEQAKNSILERVLLILSFIILLFYYFYYVNYKRYMQKQKELLESTVDEKTQELRKQKDALAFIAHYDDLTGLANKFLLQEKTKEAMKSAKETEKEFSLLLLGLDKFKEINDTYGYEIGDALLLQVAARLKECVNSDDILARFRGDKFAILHQNSTKKDTINLINRILMHTKQVFHIKNIDIFTTFSVGIASSNGESLEANQLLIFAETAMYKAKENGKNSYAFYDKKMTQLVSQRIQLDTDIKNALQNEEFVAYFQPKIDARDGHVIGLETLIRWIHPTRGMISPNEFIPFCEETGLIADIDKYMLIKSIQQMKKWQEEKIAFGKVSVNISTKKIESLNYIDELSSTIENLQFDAALLELEILEGQTMQNPEKSIEILNAMHFLGISISIDDFGTGYSSLSYLKKLPVNKIKIDRSFIINVANNKDDQAIVKTIINLAKNLNLELIAEGVETKEQLDFLVANGCYNIQGYYFSKPLTADACKEFIQDLNFSKALINS